MTKKFMTDAQRKAAFANMDENRQRTYVKPIEQEPPEPKEPPKKIEEEESNDE